MGDSGGRRVLGFALALASGILTAVGDGVSAQDRQSDVDEVEPARAPVRQEALELRERKEVVEKKEIVRQEPMVVTRKVPFTEENINGFLERAIDAPDRYRAYAEQAKRDMPGFLKQHFTFTSLESEALDKLTDSELQPIYEAIDFGLAHLEEASQRRGDLPRGWKPLTVDLEGDCWGTTRQTGTPGQPPPKPKMEFEGTVSQEGGDTKWQGKVKVTCEF